LNRFGTVDSHSADFAGVPEPVVTEPQASP
jgi:hypothetical protein